jgi:hemolysin III
MKKLLLKSNPYQTRIEEFFNALTHAAGIGLSIAALVLMIVFASRQHSNIKIVSCVLFGSSLIMMYTASTLYHISTAPKLKKFFKLVDHTIIYILIAGTYTPVTLVILQGAWGWTLFGLVWAFAIIGFIFKVFFIGRFEKLSISIYVIMGWLAIIATRPLIHALPAGGLIWLVAGGLSYTIGIIFYAMDRVHFAHVMWHLFVLGGSICHFFLVFIFVIPAPMA